MFRKNISAPAKIARIFIFSRIFRRDTFRSPLTNIRQWVQTNRFWIMLYRVTNTTHSVPKMALTSGIAIFPEFG